MSKYVAAWRATFTEGEPGPAGRDARAAQRWDLTRGVAVDLAVTVLVNDREHAWSAALEYARGKLRAPRLVTLELE